MIVLGLAVSAATTYIKGAGEFSYEGLLAAVTLALLNAATSWLRQKSTETKTVEAMSGVTPEQ